jgi:Fe-S-cluster containining protein
VNHPTPPPQQLPRRQGERRPDDAEAADFRRRMEAFYRKVDEAISAHRPVCINRGACCRFGQAGHRLYVTDAELAYFLDRQSPRGLRPVGSADACPYQEAGQCTARAHRPLGCRIYFCDPASRAWQGPEYERWHAELVRIGAESGLEYRYREWLAALRSADSGERYGPSSASRSG